MKHIFTTRRIRIRFRNAAPSLLRSLKSDIGSVCGLTANAIKMERLYTGRQNVFVTICYHWLRTPCRFSSAPTISPTQKGMRDSSLKIAFPLQIFTKSEGHFKSVLQTISSLFKIFGNYSSTSINIVQLLYRYAAQCGGEGTTVSNHAAYK